MDLSEIPAGAFQRHPWEVARAQFFAKVVRTVTAVPRGVSKRGVSVLDVGAGDGYLAEQVSITLPDDSDVVCYDPLYTDAFMAAAQRARGARCTFTRERPARSFNLLLLLDVLEHVEDDRGLLSDLVAHNLVPGGYALLSVPAHAALFTRHDISLGHYRRYSAARLRALAETSGLRVVRGSGLFYSLLPVRVLQKVLELLQGQHSAPAVRGPADGDTALGKWTGGSGVTALVAGALRIDTAWSALAASIGVGLPGLSVWVLARKP